MNYEIKKYPEYRYIDISLDVNEYPSREMLFEGVKKDSAFHYVSHTYLNGLINYTKPIKAFLMFDYVYQSDDKENILNKIESLSEQNWFHTDLGSFGTSAVVISELEDSYVLFFYDADVSDCSIYRINKSYSFNDILSFTLSEMKCRQEFENPTCDEYIELPLPQGWIKF